MIRPAQRATIASTVLSLSHALVVMAVLSSAAFGQARPATAASSGGVPSDRTHVFAINPLGIPFEIVSVEVEQAIQGAFSIGGNFSYFSPDKYSRSSFELKARLYPNEEAPRAFSVGLGVGAVNTREHVMVDVVRTLRDKTSPSIGVYVDYNWLLGRTRRFYVGSGLGAKRILGDSDAFDEAPFVYGTARFLIGVAF
jgi:hypothetical protein